MSRLSSIETGSSAEVIAKMIKTLFPDVETVLDTTYGHGGFWDGTLDVTVVGMDLDPTRARDVVADFRALPFADASFDLVVFDPPFLTDTSKGGLMGERFGSFGSIPDLQRAVEAGLMEAWRVARIGVLIKVQNYIHGSLPVRMTRWVEDLIPYDAYGEVHLLRSSKLLDRKWGDQLSVYSNHATFLAYRHGNQRHIRRTRPVLEAVS